jgi:putative ABC transport system permease protein
MKFWDLLSLIRDNLGRRKGRVALTAVGVVIGTAAVVVLVSLAVGLQQNATNQLWGISDLTKIEVYPGYSESGMVEVKMGGGGGGGAVPEAKLLTPDVLEQFKALPGVKVVVAQDYLQMGTDMVVGKFHGYANLTGVDVSDLAVLELPIFQGSTQLSRGTAVVGSYVARNFYDPNLRPGQDPPAPPELYDQQIRVILMKWTNDGQEVRKTVTLRVTGVLAETRGQEDNNIYVSMDELTAWNEGGRGSRINRNKEGYNYVIVKAEDVDQVTDVAQQISDMGFMVNNPQGYVDSINGFFMILQVIFGGVGAIALLVAAIGIANTMTMAILERTREIGLMKAVGATNRDVMSIFLGEAAGIGLLGGLGGVVLGWGAVQALNVVAVAYLAQQSSQGGGMSTTTVAAVTPLWLPIFAMVFSALVGLLSGLYPAMNAAAQPPLTALKYE